MCRCLAYSGDPVLLDELLYKPEYSLIVQSLHSRLGAETTNGDGFGVGWYGAQSTPGLFHSVEPAWNHRNLRELATDVASPLILAHIRASSGSAVSRPTAIPSGTAAGSGCTTSSASSWRSPSGWRTIHLAPPNAPSAWSRRPAGPTASSTRSR
jgi:hypothetical protein